MSVVARGGINRGRPRCTCFCTAAWYFFANLEISRAVPSIMYFAYMALVSAGFAAVTGAVGFLACSAFCRAIYGSVKIVSRRRRRRRHPTTRESR